MMDLRCQVGGGWMSPNEARAGENMKPVDGGDSPYLQQQNYSLAALAKRDAKVDPFAGAPNPVPDTPAPGMPSTETPAPAPAPAPEVLMTFCGTPPFVSGFLDTLYSVFVWLYSRHLYILLP